MNYIFQKNKNFKKIALFYKKNGFVIIRGLFKKKEYDYLDKKISKFSNKHWHNIMNPDRLDFLIAQSSEKINSQKTLIKKIEIIEEAAETAKKFRNFLIDKRVKECLEKTTKKKFNALMMHIIFKQARTKYAKQSWAEHQDNSYAKMKNEGFVTTNLFIHKTNKENGCIYIYPGSQKKGLYKFERKLGYDYDTSKKERPGNKTKINLSKFKRIDLNVNSGDFLIMNGNCVHGSYVNKSKTKSRHLISAGYGELNKKFNPGINAKRQRIYFNNQ